MKQETVDVALVMKMADEAHWTEAILQKNPLMLSFIRWVPIREHSNELDRQRINIYLNTWTVVTCVRHPKKGKTQLFRRNCDLFEIQAILNNPRVHLVKEGKRHKGYRTK